MLFIVNIVKQKNENIANPMEDFKKWWLVCKDLNTNTIKLTAANKPKHEDTIVINGRNNPMMKKTIKPINENNIHFKLFAILIPPLL